MNRNEKDLLLPRVSANTTGCSIEFHPHMMIAVTTIVVSQHTTLSCFSQKLICVIEIDNERFEINVLHEEVAAGIQFKFKFIRQAVEQFSGWKVSLYKMCGSATDNGKMIIDRGTKHLYVSADLLQISLPSIIKLFGRVSEFLETLSGRMRSALDGFGKHCNPNIIRVNEQASIGLTVSENGLCFPSHYVFSADELFVHVSINENEIYLRFDNGWRMFHRSNDPLPFYAYKSPIEVTERGYTIPIPVDVSHALLIANGEITFDVHAD